MPQIHFREWGKRLWGWIRFTIVRRWWILSLLGLYKLAEDRILTSANNEIDNHDGWLPEIAAWIVDVLPAITWLLLPVTIAYLLYRSYLDSRPSPTASAPGQAGMGYEGKVFRPERVTIEHDGMEWEYGGKRTDPKGPFCLDDHTPLAYVDNQTSIQSHRVVPYFRKDAAHMGGYHGYLVCLQCHREYGKDDVVSYKTVEQSLNEARRIFEGMENRGEV